MFLTIFTNNAVSHVFPFQSLKSKMSSSGGSSSATGSASSSPMPMPTLASDRPSNGASSGGDSEEENLQYIIYYMLGGFCIRPMGIVTGEWSFVLL